jgi:hypothetical protein
MEFHYVPHSYSPARPTKLCLCSCLTTPTHPPKILPKCSPLSNNENFRFLFSSLRKTLKLVFRITSMRKRANGMRGARQTHHRIGYIGNKLFSLPEIFKDMGWKREYIHPVDFHLSRPRQSKVIRLSSIVHTLDRDGKSIKVLTLRGRNFAISRKLKVGKRLGAGWAASSVCVTTWPSNRRHIAAEEFEYIYYI